MLALTRPRGLVRNERQDISDHDGEVFDPDVGVAQGLDGEGRQMLGTECLFAGSQRLAFLYCQGDAFRPIHP